VVMKSINFWDITPCSPLSVNRRFGGTYRLHIQGRRNKLSKKSASKRVVHPKRRLTLNRLHGVISKKLILFLQDFDKKFNAETSVLKLCVLALSLTECCIVVAIAVASGNLKF
jgi:hypothetical protein